MKTKTPYPLILTALSFLYLLFCSVNTSILYPYAYSQDASLFLTLGKSTAAGLTPYLDVFDHKGPLLYLLEAPGFLISDRAGTVFVFCLQFLCLSFGLIAMYGLLSQFVRPISAFALCVLTCCYLIATIGAGNRNEEFCFPFIALSILVMFSRSDDPRRLIMVGFSFASCFLIRVNNAGPIAGCIVFLIIYRFIHRDGRVLIRELMFFTLGFLLVFIPISAWMFHTDAWDAMWYASLFYNLKVVGSYASASLLIKALKSLPVILIFLLSFVSPESDRERLACRCISLTTLPCLMIGSGYWHYYVIMVPLLPLLYLQICHLRSAVSFRSLRLLIYAAFLFTLAIYGRNVIMNTQDALQAACNREEYRYRAEQLRMAYESIPEEEREDLMTYNAEGEFYLINDILPNYKYFTLQSSQSRSDERINREWNEELKQREPLWLIINWNKENNNEELINYAMEHYEVIGTYYGYEVRRRIV